MNETKTRQVLAAVLDVEGQARSLESPFKHFAIRTRRALAERAEFWKRTIARFRQNLPTLDTDFKLTTLASAVQRIFEIEERWLRDMAGTKEDGDLVVVIIGYKAYLGNIIGHGTVHFARADDVIVFDEDPTQEVSEDLVMPWMTREVDEHNPRIQLDDGRIFWGIQHRWYPVVPQPTAP